MADKIKVYRDDSGAWRWSKIAENEAKVASSGEAFASRGNAIRAAWHEAAGTDATVEVAEEPDAAA